MAATAARASARALASADRVKFRVTQGVFAEARPYFVAVQLGDAAKDRTEVSTASERPFFRNATFEVPQNGSLHLGTPVKLHLGAFVVWKHAPGTKGEAKLLGVGAYKLRQCIARLLAGETVTTDVVLRRDPRDPASPALGKVTVELQYIRGGRRSSVTGSAEAVSAASVSVFVRSAMNLPLVGEDDDLPNARVQVHVEYPGDADDGEGKDGGGGAASGGGGKRKQHVFTHSVSEERNPRWDRMLQVALPRESDGPGASSSRAKTHADGVLVVDVFDVGVLPGSDGGGGMDVAEREPGRIAGARLPLRFFPYGHSHNLRIRWPAFDVAALFVTVRVAPPHVGDERMLEAQPGVQRLQAIVHGFEAGGAIPPVWLDLTPNHPSDALVGHDSALETQQLLDAELVCVGDLVDADTADTLFAQGIAGRDSDGSSRPATAKSTKSAKSAKSDKSGGEGKVAPSADAFGVLGDLSQMPLTTVDADTEGGVDAGLFEHNIGDASTMRSLSQVTGPAVPPAATPQWGRPVEFTLGPDRKCGIDTYPDALLAPRPCAVHLAFFRRDVPPVSPVKGAHARKHSIAGPASAPPLPAPQLRLGRTLLRLPSTLPLDGAPVTLTGIPVEDCTNVTVVRDESPSTGAGRGSPAAASVKSTGKTVQATVKVTLRAWGGAAFALSRIQASAAESQALQQRRNDAAEAERKAREAAVEPDRASTPELVKAPWADGDGGDGASDALAAAAAKAAGGVDGGGGEGGLGSSRGSARSGRSVGSGGGGGGAAGAGTGDGSEGEGESKAGTSLTSARSQHSDSKSGGHSSAAAHEAMADDALRSQFDTSTSEEDAFLDNPPTDLAGTGTTARSRSTRHSTAQGDPTPRPASSGSQKTHPPHGTASGRSASRSSMVSETGDSVSSSVVARQAALEAEIARMRGEAMRGAATEAELRDLVDRLRREVDRRSEAIRSCGVEIVRLRKEVKTVAGANRRLAAQAEAEAKRRERDDREVSEDALGNAMRNVDLGDPDAVMRRMQLLAKKYIAERRRSHELGTEVERLQSVGVANANLQRQYDRLLEAHTRQQSVVQSLQEDAKEAIVHKETIKTQEKVIAKLEEVLESRMAERMGREGPPRGKWRGSRGDGDASTVRSGSAEDASADGDGDDAAPVEAPEVEEGWMDPMFGGGKTMTCTEVAWGTLNASNIAKTARVEVLESELLVNAKDFAGTMSELKMKIMELEMGGGMGMDDDFGGDGDGEGALSEFSGSLPSGDFDFADD